MREGYDVAEICLNGHVTTSMALSFPQHKQSFCEKCGESTITACPKCENPIRGQYHCSGVISLFEYSPPSFCINCGSKYPWTIRNQHAALELFKEEMQDEQKIQEFSESIEEITKSTPSSQVASKRLNKLLGKIAKGTASAIRDILVDLASETAKKILMEGS